jgi:flagellar biosynthesis/type III secretory pathway protein FliH
MTDRAKLSSKERVAETRREWRCFHCDEVFTDWGEARNHFGYTPEDGPPSCKTTRGEDSELYHLKRRLELYQREDTELHRELHAKSAEMAAAVRQAEEQGYARGLQDAKKYPETLGLRAAS